MSTLELEISLIWGSKLNVMKVLYLFTRYLPFTVVSSFMYCESPMCLNPMKCLTCHWYGLITGDQFGSGISVHACATAYKLGTCGLQSLLRLCVLTFDIFCPSSGLFAISASFSSCGYPLLRISFTEAFIRWLLLFSDPNSKDVGYLGKGEIFHVCLVWGIWSHVVVNFHHCRALLEGDHQWVLRHSP